MVDFKLANILLSLPEHLRCFPQMLYRAMEAVDYQKEDGSLAFAGRIEFLTYFNALSFGKWQRYTGIENAFLHLELVGDACDIILLGVPEGAVDVKDAPGISEVHTSSALPASIVAKQLALPVHFDGAAEYEAIDLPVDATGMVLVGFALVSAGATALKGAYWATRIPEERIRDVRIAVATTTFKNEQYILPNMEMIREHVLESQEPVAQTLHLFVVDNGCTLDADALSGKGVTVIPNANEGGSAGFARGMMEALESDAGFTHVLLMDDDVRVSPESLIRTHNLLSLVREEYADAFINGAMLEMERPNKQFEDVSHVRPDGVYRRLKGDLFMDALADITMNEVLDVEVPQAYGAWWYSCIPMSAIREHGLPLPLFVRCDDVEYGIRARAKYMTMNGICVWHAAFTQKFRAAVDCYQYIRNYLVMNSIHGVSNDSLFLARADRTLQLYLRSMAYETAELIVAALEDYMRGPAWLMSVRGEALLKENNAKAEKLVSLDEALSDAASLYPEYAEALRGFVPDQELVRDDQAAGPALRLWRSLPYDRHLLPGVCIQDKAATAYYGGYTVISPDQVGKRMLVACDRECENAHVRLMDRKRWSAIRKRWRSVRADHRKRGRETVQAYQAALPYMTSVEYWKRHLEEMSQ